MPFFPKKYAKENSPKGFVYDSNRVAQPECSKEDEEDKQMPVFYCQQAQGSPTGIISGFNNVKELYQKISECYDFEPSEVNFIQSKFVLFLRFEAWDLQRSVTVIKYLIFPHLKDMYPCFVITLACNYYDFITTGITFGGLFIKEGDWGVGWVVIFYTNALYKVLLWFRRCILNAGTSVIEILNRFYSLTLGFVFVF